MAGLAILGTLLASMVVARSRYLHQWTRAGRQEQATVAADALLSEWWAKPEKLPRHSQGQLPKLKMRWQTHVIDSPVAKELQVQVVRLEMFDQTENALKASPATALPIPLVQVDVVVNKDEKTQAQNETNAGAVPSSENP